MNRSIIRIILILFLLPTAACARPQGTTRADYGRISELRIKYKDAYVFKKKESTLLVFKMAEGPVDEGLIEQMYREFYFDIKDQFRNNTAMKDLKLHDADGQFLYGLRYVWWKGRIVKE